MLSEWEQLHGGDEVVVHDYSHTYFCGRCGNMMSKEKNYLDCPGCHLHQSDNNGTMFG